MKLKLPLGLRNDAQQVRVIKINGSSRPQLGTSQPEEENRRRKVVGQWGALAGSPRQERPEGIDVPLSQRSQTILSHRLASGLRQVLDSGVGSGADAHRARQPEKETSAPLRQAGEDES